MGGLLVRSVLKYLEENPAVIERLVAAGIAAFVEHLTNPHRDAPATDPSAAGAGA